VTFFASSGLHSIFEIVHRKHILFEVLLLTIMKVD